MIGCSAWPRGKIDGNTKLGGNAGCITEVEVGTGWFVKGVMIAREGLMGKDVDGNSLFTPNIKVVFPKSIR